MVLRRFLPHDAQFFTLFRDAAANASATANALVDLLTNYQDVEAKVRGVRELEHRGDEVSHKIFHALNSTFVTPLDREDIQELATRLDDFVDYIEEATRRLWLYRVGQPTQMAQRLGRIIQAQATSMATAIPALENNKQSALVREHTVEINRLENEADDVLNLALGSLYDHAADIPSLIDAIHWGELYQLLEDATDRAEDVANTLDTIVLKYA